MRLIKSYYIIEDEINGDEILKKIEKAGRTCYKSEDKITENSAKIFVEKILKSGHESVIEHEKISVRFICDRGVSHELVRHRLASFSQESTRYCNYGKQEHITFIIPCWLDSVFPEGIYEYRDEDNFTYNGETCFPHNYQQSMAAIKTGAKAWLNIIWGIETKYNLLIKFFNWQPQQARSVLPNSLKTEIVVTANLREWRLIFKLRTSKKAHPQMRELMIPLLKDFQTRIPVLFDDITIQ